MATRRKYRSARLLSCATLAACGLADPAVSHAASATINISSASIGVTPRYLGFNMGHYMPSSNTTAWLQYSGTNGYRVWVAASDYEGSDDIAPYGDGITTQSGFESRKALMRANPESSTYANWTQFNDRFANMTQSGRNNVRLNTILGELQKSGVEPILNLTRSENYSYSGWGGKWEQWQFAYVMAYHAAKNYDVQRFQWYNEPDQNASTITITDYADRLRTTADAFRSAIEDVNRIHGKSLVANVSAPTTKNGSSTIDTWGAPILQANRTDYAGNPSPVDIFNTYDLHRYNVTAGGMSSDVTTANVKIPLYNATGVTMPVTFTEFNRYNTSTFSGMTESLDTPEVFSEYAGDYLGAMSAGVKGMYAFKFSQTVWTDPGFSEPMKTGHYYVDDFGNNNISGASQGAEVARLVSKAFKSERPRLNSGVLGVSGSDTFGASLDQGRGDYYFMNSNPSATDLNFTMDLTPWNITPGQVVAIQEVSSVHHGSVSQLVTVGADRKITFSQPGESVALVNIPSGGLQTVVPIGASADAQVNNAAKAVNYGALPSANVARNSSTTADQATYFKFDLGATDKATVDRAFLRLTGQNTANTDLTTLHVYGITDDTWNELTINWNNAPNLAGASDAKLTGVGTSAFPVGQLTYDDDSDTWRIDVTDFVRGQGAGDAITSFAVIREQRFAGDADSSVVQLNTRESLSDMPELTLYTLDHPQYFWKNNFNGAVFGHGPNWNGGGAAPNSAGAVVLLGDFSTAAHTVNVTTSATLGELRFDNDHRYILSGVGTLTFDSGSANPSAIKVFKGDHAISTPLAVATPTTIQVDTNAFLTLANAATITGSAPITITGAGTLVMGDVNPSFSGGITINSGTVRVVTSNANAITGLGTGPVVVNGATLRLEGVQLGASGKPGPDLTLNNGASLLATGATTFSKSGSPMIPVAAGTSVNISTGAASDVFTILSAFRNTTAALSFATINVNGPGRVVLQSGGLSSNTTYSGGWALSNGSLQLGPTSASTSEALNALGFKNADAKQGNAITVTGGATLIGAVNTPQDALVTPNFFRANVTLTSGKLATTGVASSNWGGNFTNTNGSTSTILVYDPLSPTTARDVNLVAGAAGTLNNAASTSWAGTVVVSPGAQSTGGAFNINRTGGTIAVTTGATLQIDAGAKVNLGGTADALNDGTRRVNVVNNSTSGFNVTTSTKNIAALTGAGGSSVSSGATLIADHVRQSSANITGTLRTRDNGQSNGTSDLDTLTINAGGAFDLRDNRLVVRTTPIGSWNGSGYTGVTGMIANGRGDGTWNGSGLTTSMTDATIGVLTTLAVATASEIGAGPTWLGRTVAGDDALVMYTWGGDADLNGELNGDDYFFLDSNILQSGSVFGFHNGDFNYDGELNGDDYFILDSNILQAQGSTPFVASTGGATSVALSAVPEPTSLAACGLAGALFLRRRR